MWLQVKTSFLQQNLFHPFPAKSQYQNCLKGSSQNYRTYPTIPSLIRTLFENNRAMFNMFTYLSVYGFMLNKCLHSVEWMRAWHRHRKNVRTSGQSFLDVGYTMPSRLFQWYIFVFQPFKFIICAAQSVSYSHKTNLTDSNTFVCTHTQTHASAWTGDIAPYQGRRLSCFIYIRHSGLCSVEVDIIWAGPVTVLEVSTLFRWCWPDLVTALEYIHTAHPGHPSDAAPYLGRCCCCGSCSWLPEVDVPVEADTDVLMPLSSTSPDTFSGPSTSDSTADASAPASVSVSTDSRDSAMLDAQPAN